MSQQVRPARLRALAGAALSGVLAVGGVALAGIASAEVVSAAPAEELPLRVVQLGDSYSAGNGTRDASGNPAYDPEVPDCYRSDLNYGGQFAAGIGADYVNAACSGGVFLDIRTPKSDAVPAQIDAVDAASDVVLMTMGGNDIGFSSIVTQCFVLRSASNCRTQIESAADYLPTLEEVAYAEISAVRAKMRPDAAFIYLGYPNLTSAESLVLGGGDDAYDVVPALADLMARGAEVQQSAIARVNADHPCGGRSYYVDSVDETFAGHEIDQSLAIQEPDRWFWNAFENLTFVEWYHPKQPGWDAEAALLSQFYADNVAVEATLELDPASAKQGTDVEVTGTGFRSGDSVQVTLSPDVDVSVTADQCGAIAGTLALSSTSPVGERVVSAASTITGKSASADLTVTRAPTPPDNEGGDDDGEGGGGGGGGDSAGGEGAGDGSGDTTAPVDSPGGAASVGTGPGSQRPSDLRNTGAPDSLYALAAIALMLGGGALVLLGRRRRGGLLG